MSIGVPAIKNQFDTRNIKHTFVLQWSADSRERPRQFKRFKEEIGEFLQDVDYNTDVRTLM
eukprot:snap_masked-scaffold_16-processed-gene-2.20-mRNA-1 protein AED:1.00 eAED:1.00 QI:0/0/0/0/1/1/2/0/60